MRRLAFAAASVTVAVGVAACGGSDSNSSGGASSGGKGFAMTIGDVEAYTGDLGALGGPADKAVKLAAQQLTQASKQSGTHYSFTVKSADTASDPQSAISAARQVIGDGAKCLTGPVSTPEATAILNSVTKVRKTPMLPSATSTALDEVDDAGTIFRTTPPDSLQATALVKAVQQGLGGAQGKTVAIGYQNAPYGEGLATRFASAWKAMGGKVVGPVGYDPSQPSYDSEAAKLTAGNPDAWVFADYPDTFGKVAAAMLRTGKFDGSKLYVSDALAVSPIPKTIPAQALEGAHVTSAGSPTGTPQAKAFAKLFASSPGPKTGALVGNMFDSGVLCGLAAIAAGSDEPAKITEQLGRIDGPEGKPFTYLQLADAIKALKAGQQIHYVGVSGPIEFDAKGDTSSGLYDVSQWVHGKLAVKDHIEVKAG